MKKCSIVQFLFFPVVISAFAICLWLFPGDIIAGHIALVAAILLGIIFEKLIPFSNEWQNGHGDWKSDVFHGAITLLIGPILNTGLVAFVSKVSADFQLFQIRWLIDSPMTVQVLMALLISGFFPYVIHRLAHERGGFLWRVHAIHHSPQRLYWLNALRLHPVNVVWNVAGGLIPLLILGMRPEVIFMTGMLNNFMAFYNHMNIDFRLGPLNYIFNMGELHRWHHSQEPAEANNNYSGGLLSIWDLILGTRFLPNRKINPQGMGLYLSSRQSFPQKSKLKQILYPFCQCGEN